MVLAVDKSLGRSFKAISDKWNILKNLETHRFFPELAQLRLTAWKLSADLSMRNALRRRLPPRDVVSQPSGFMMSVPHTWCADGVLHEHWIPILPL